MDDIEGVCGPLVPLRRRLSPLHHVVTWRLLDPGAHRGDRDTEETSSYTLTVPGLVG